MSNTVSTTILYELSTETLSSGSVLEVDPTSVEERGDVTIKLYAVGVATHRVFSPFGTSLGVGSIIGNSDKRKTETITFSNSNSGSTQFPIEYIFSALALSPITIFEDGSPVVYINRGADCKSQLQLVAENRSSFEFQDNIQVYGALDIEYETVSNYTRWIWNAPSKADKDTPLMFFVTENDVLIHTFTVTVTDTDGSGDDEEYRDIIIKVEDVCSGIIIPDADVYIDNVYRGYSDEDGLLPVKLKVGEHQIKITATNYIDSDIDELDNEEITVQ